MLLSIYKRVKHRLGTSSPSSQLLRVANGTIMESEATWKGVVKVNGVSAEVAFEVFDSGGKWDFLFGKTLLETFKAIHNYESNKIIIHRTGGKTTLHNQGHTIAKQEHQPVPPTPVCIVTEEAQPNGDEELSEVEVETFQNNANLFTCMTEPHKPERVQELLCLITIGDNISMEEQQKVRQLISSFTDIFALSVSEVKIVEDAVHHLDIPPEATFSIKNP